MTQTETISMATISQNLMLISASKNSDIRDPGNVQKLCAYSILDS